ncbi:MAG TPA: hypothetical protein VHJ20_10190 [Polyangia bacterium]|nr:hypothetical protein [Polyangia bacterium]
MSFYRPTKTRVVIQMARTFIGDLRIMIESDIQLVGPQKGDALLKDGKAEGTTPFLPAYNVSTSEGVTRYVVTHRWTNVLPDQTAELRIRRVSN